MLFLNFFGLTFTFTSSGPRTSFHSLKIGKRRIFNSKKNLQGKDFNLKMILPLEKLNFFPHVEICRFCCWFVGQINISEIDKLQDKIDFINQRYLSEYFTQKVPVLPTPNFWKKVSFWRRNPGFKSCGLDHAGGKSCAQKWPWKMQTSHRFSKVQI